MDGEPFCIKREKDKMCCRDLIIVSTFKTCPECGNLTSKTKKEMEAEIQAILKKNEKGKRR